MVAWVVVVARVNIWNPITMQIIVAKVNIWCPVNEVWLHEWHCGQSRYMRFQSMKHGCMNGIQYMRSSQWSMVAWMALWPELIYEVQSMKYGCMNAIVTRVNIWGPVNEVWLHEWHCGQNRYMRFQSMKYGCMNGIQYMRSSQWSMVAWMALWPELIYEVQSMKYGCMNGIVARVNIWGSSQWSMVAWVIIVARVNIWGPVNEVWLHEWHCGQS